MFSQNREQMRAVFVDAWRKQSDGLPMSQLELAVAAVIVEHPEYHPLLEDSNRALHEDFNPEGGASNPFLHMAMHLSLREQIGTNRPAGIGDIFRQLVSRSGSAHDAEHRMLDVLGKHIWQSSRSGLPPDDKAYIQDLKRLVSN